MVGECAAERVAAFYSWDDSMCANHQLRSKCQVAFTGVSINALVHAPALGQPQGRQGRHDVGQQGQL